ncbi:hypothetical protein CFK39_11535 [Brachybacterium avium]|uniref:Insertion element IS150 protein InsJ-like helix-turn-helix domain-containing protein n=2 Tax=Brachybacterium avium TaxID=2017485 RepID=A0A220U8I1_9MICO|nr:hypothetical protein CFK39_00665 [Brachybacterium avium]ASK66348.1 hypothetical protein CFK39_11535 [Brachybacterium avium]
MSKNTAIVLSVIEAGMSTNEAAQKFHVSPRWVQILVARYRKGGVEALDPGSRRRPPWEEPARGTTPCAPTESTPTAKSPCATPARCATSASAAPTPD